MAAYDPDDDQPMSNDDDTELDTTDYGRKRVAAEAEPDDKPAKPKRRKQSQRPKGKR